MRRNQIIPSRGDGKDIGYKYVLGGKMVHYYRSRAGANIAVSHCGIISQVNLLNEPGNLPTCTYCSMIESMRDNVPADQ